MLLTIDLPAWLVQLAHLPLSHAAQIARPLITNKHTQQQQCSDGNTTHTRWMSLGTDLMIHDCFSRRMTPWHKQKGAQSPLLVSFLTRTYDLWRLWKRKADWFGLASLYFTVPRQKRSYPRFSIVFRPILHSFDSRLSFYLPWSQILSILLVQPTLPANRRLR